MKGNRGDVFCRFGKPVSEPFRTDSLCPAGDAFSRMDRKELIFDLASGKTYTDADFPAVMCGDLGLSRAGVESLHFRLPEEPGFYRLDFGFHNLTHQQVREGDNCKYPINERGRMPEEDVLHYIKHYDEQLDSEDPDAEIEFNRIDQMNHHSHYARVEILLDGVEIGAFQLSPPFFVREGGNRFVPETYSRTVAIASPGPHTLTVRAVNRWCPLRSARRAQYGTIVTEDFCPTFLSVRKASAPTSYNAFAKDAPDASIDLCVVNAACHTSSPAAWKKDRKRVGR